MAFSMQPDGGATYVGVTEDFDVNVGLNKDYSGGSQAYAALQTGLTVSNTMGTANGTLSVASFGPA